MQKTSELLRKTKKWLQDSNSRFKHLLIKPKHVSFSGNIANENFAKPTLFYKPFFGFFWVPFAYIRQWLTQIKINLNLIHCISLVITLQFALCVKRYDQEEISCDTEII